MKYFEYFSEADVAQVHTATLKVLEETGVDFMYEPALALLKNAGCKVDGQRVFFPPQLVEAQVAKAPSEFTLYARNPDKNVVIGGDHIAYIPCYGAPVVVDLDRGRRESTLADYLNFVKLAYASPYQDITGGILAEPNDIPIARRNAEMISTCLRYSDKPFMGAGTGPEAAQETIEMAKIAFGVETDLADRPPFISILCSKTPLAFDDRMLGAIMTYAAAGMPQLISSLSIAGATSPVTMAGTQVVQNAEILAGITLTQLVREGTPVVFSGSSSCAALRYGTLSIGAPEMAINTAATAQMGRFYGIPSRSGGAVTDAKLCDCQSASESMMSQLMATLAGIHFVLHSAGILESYMVASYEKFVLDDQICGMCKQIKKGPAVTSDDLAVDLINQVGPEGEYLTQMHTFQKFKQALYQPVLDERGSYESWQQSGGLSLEQKANQEWKETLAEYVEPDFLPEIERDLRKYVESK